MAESASATPSRNVRTEDLVGILTTQNQILMMGLVAVRNRANREFANNPRLIDFDCMAKTASDAITRALACTESVFAGREKARNAVLDGLVQLGALLPKEAEAAKYGSHEG